MNAMYASLVLMDSSIAIVDRFLFLFIGIAIVFIMHAIQTLFKYYKQHLISQPHFS